MLCCGWGGDSLYRNLTYCLEKRNLGTWNCWLKGRPNKPTKARGRWQWQRMDNGPKKSWQKWTIILYLDSTIWHFVSTFQPAKFKPKAEPIADGRCRHKDGFDILRLLAIGYYCIGILESGRHTCCVSWKLLPCKSCGRSFQQYVHNLGIAESLLVTLQQKRTNVCAVSFKCFHCF